MSTMHGMLRICSVDEARGHEIITAFESLIPVAGSKNERKLLSEAEWQEAKRSKTPPRLFEDGTGDSQRLPPILDRILDTSGDIASEKWKHEFEAQMFMPIVACSIASLARWLHIFAVKHGLNLSSLGYSNHGNIPGDVDIHTTNCIATGVATSVHHDNCIAFTTASRLHHDTPRFWTAETCRDQALD
jgi:hypothetical protein